MFTWLYLKISNYFYHWLTYEPPPTEMMPYDFNRLKYELRPGDVLLIEGRSHISRIIRSITQSSWTHAALYIGRPIDFEDEELQNIMLKHNPDTKEKTRLIIEDLIDKGTVINTINVYHNHHIRICRPIGITPADLQLVIKHAVKALGQPYSMRHVIDLARFLLPWTILPRRFGSTLFRNSTGEPESGICSSLIAEAFTSVKFPILPYVKADLAKGIEVFPRNPYLFTPKDFDYSPYFEIIKYPLFNPDEPMPYYKRMPWTKTGLLHQDYGLLTQGIPRTKKRLRLFRRKVSEKIEKESIDKDKNKE